jgi:NO-binding membrane sensor protein with MHYT domain
MPTVTADPSRTIRRLLLALAAFGLTGTTTELVLLEHYEETTMLVPLVVNVAAVAAILLHFLADNATSVRLLRAIMAVLVVTSLVGVGLHYQGSLAFQIDMDPTLSASQLFWKVMHMKAPPTLAPGALAQLGLLGLISTYRHPALRRREG